MTEQPATFVQGNLFEAKVSQADVVYLDVNVSMMEPLQKKLSQELKFGAMVITNTQRFPDWQPAEEYIIHANKPDY